MEEIYFIGTCLAADKAIAADEMPIGTVIILTDNDIDNEEEEELYF